MSTDYYVYLPNGVMLGEAHEPLRSAFHRMHIGRSKVGWVFLLHVYDPNDRDDDDWLDDRGVLAPPELFDNPPDSWGRWRELIERPGVVVMDSRARRIRASRMDVIVTQRKHRAGLRRCPESAQAPNRVRHTAGTYDLCWGGDVFDE